MTEAANKQPSIRLFINKSNNLISFGEHLIKLEHNANDNHHIHASVIR